MNHEISLIDEDMPVFSTVLKPEWLQPCLSVCFDPVDLEGAEAWEVQAEVQTAHWILANQNCSEDVLHFLTNLKNACDKHPGTRLTVSINEEGLNQ